MDFIYEYMRANCSHDVADWTSVVPMSPLLLSCPYQLTILNHNFISFNDCVTCAVKTLSLNNLWKKYWIKTVNINYSVQEILGCDSEGGNQCLAQAHPDPFLRSMALWILKDYTGSLNTLLQTNTGSMHPQYSDSDDKFEGSSGKT